MFLAERARELLAANNDEGFFLLAEEGWPGPDADLSLAVGEVARNAYVRSTELCLSQRELWYARALVASVLMQANETAAVLLMRPALALVEQGQFDAALLTLDEMRRLVKRTDRSWRRLVGPLYHHKRAAVLLVAGRLDEVEVELRLAAAYSATARDLLKINGGKWLVAYLRLEGRPPDQFRVEADVCLDETEAIYDAARISGFNDVKVWAATNLEVMRRGVFDGWAPYEVL